jgi:hypothetical protein
MIRLELTEEEAERLRDLCDVALSDLRMEIAGTDSMEFRERLKQDAGFLKSLIEQITRAAHLA